MSTPRASSLVLLMPSSQRLKHPAKDTFPSIDGMRIVDPGAMGKSLASDPSSLSSCLKPPKPNSLPTWTISSATIPKHSTSSTIPFKRSYLFYGLPGTGKTSLIQAMGGQYERNLYFLQPTHPKMTDDSLRSAIEKVPRKSIIVLEDIDALFFDKDRQKKVKQTPLTFSGLLNALDGVGSPDGHIFVLTTNFRDQLDDALIRNGRVDVHVAFEHTTEEQMEAMFVSFYPGEKDGKAFATALTAALGSRKMSMAALQHYFVTQRRKSAAEAIANVGEVVRELEERQKEADEEAARAEEEDEEEGDNEENDDDET
ncbi:hypothetical protein LEN26_002970 [Aphanomyces euteiches]|nr:hypothetical protein LEN26_002970 [Aphanomyces euteiches]